MLGAVGLTVLVNRMPAEGERAVTERPATLAFLQVKQVQMKRLHLPYPSRCAPSVMRGGYSPLISGAIHSAKNASRRDKRINVRPMEILIDVAKARSRALKDVCKFGCMVFCLCDFGLVSSG